MNILSHLRFRYRSFLLIAFSIQLLTSCKPKSSQDLNLPANSQKTETNHTIEPVRKSSSPLLQKLHDTSDTEERAKLVVQLGDQKVVEAIPYLVEKITTIKSPQVYNAMDLDRAYPCSAALVQIGEVAVPQIKSQLVANSSNVEQLILLHTLIRIKGPKFVADSLEALKPEDQKIIGTDRLSELKNWVASQVQPSGVTVQQTTK